MELPAANAITQGPGAIGLWFKTASAGGVLLSYQSFLVGTTPGSGDTWNPALYVGADGKLRGELWNNNSSGAITSTSQVTDGKWQYALIDATATNSQTLYLDGTAQGTLAGTIRPQSVNHVYVGAGTATNWPSAPTDPDGHFNGTIAAATVFPMGLNTAQVSNLSTIPVGTDTSTPQMLYDAIAVDLHPLGYWPLDDASGNQATELLTSAAKAQNQATYNNATGGGTGPWASGTTSATNLNGTTSDVALPGTVATLHSPSSVEVWFKTSTAGVIYSYQSFPLGNTPNGTTDHWNPALYVDTNGYLYTGSSLNQTVSSVKVTGTGWHMAALVANGTTQQLYLDGQPTGSPVTGTVTYNGEGYAYLGAGYQAGSWTNTSAPRPRLTAAPWPTTPTTWSSRKLPGPPARPGTSTPQAAWPGGPPRPTTRALGPRLEPAPTTTPPTATALTGPLTLAVLSAGMSRASTLTSSPPPMPPGTPSCS